MYALEIKGIVQIDKLEILKIASKNLANIDYKNIFRLICEVGLTNMIGFNIPEGTTITRLRPSEDKPFSNQSEISYNPKCDKFGRANAQNNPMFYGSFAAPKMQEPILTNTAEIIHVLANGNHKIQNDSIEFTIGEWKIIKPLPVFPMIFKDSYLLKNEIFRPLYNTYISKNRNYPRNKKIIEFIAQEFSKDEILSDSDYKITAAFTELLLKSYKSKIEAIIYPSVRAYGNGFNIALTPDFVKKHLRLVKVYTAKMYYKYPFGALDFEQIAESINNEGVFKLKPITEPGVTKGREWCIKEIEKMKDKK